VTDSQVTSPVVTDVELAQQKLVSLPLPQLKSCITEIPYSLLPQSMYWQNTTQIPRVQKQEGYQERLFAV
jgi:hypothetical protein